MDRHGLGSSDQGPSHVRMGSNSTDHKASVGRAIYPSTTTMREREQSVGAWSASSVGTGDGRSGASPSVTRSASRRASKGNTASRYGPSGGRGPDGKRKIDRHTLALKSIREFLRGRNCYDCLPVSFRLVVLDTKLIVKPALDIMWQAGIVSAPLWQSTTEPFSAHTDSSPNDTSAVQSSGEEANEPTDLSPAATGEGSPYVTSPTSYPSSSLTSAMLSSFSPTSQNNVEGNTDRIIQRDNPLPPGRTGFAGMLTVNDIIHLIQYYYKTAKQGEAAQMVEKFRLGRLREIENTLHVPPPPLLSIDPMRPIFDACQLLLKTHARRLPLLDHDDQTGMDVVVSVLTQYRVLKFIAMNCRETAALHRSIRSLGIGTYIASMSNHNTRSMTGASNVSSSRRSSNAATSNVPPSSIETDENNSAKEAGVPNVGEETGAVNEEALQERRGSGLDSTYPLATVTLDTTVIDVIHIFSELGISGVPVLDEAGFAVDLYETVDVIDLVRAGAFQQLDLTIREALARRSKDFSGVMTCSPDDSLATIFTLLRTRRVHRLLILEPENNVTSLGNLQEEQTIIHAAVANDTSAVGDGVSLSEDVKARREAGGSTSEAKTNPFEDIPHRKRGKLLGILCLSDIMRYLIASPNAQATEKIGRLHKGARTGSGLAGVGTSFSTAPSSLDTNDGAGVAPRSRQTSTDGAHASTTEEDSSSANANAVSGSTVSDIADVTTLADAASRFDPKDVPPTIEENPTAEATSPVTHTLEDQTPTQEAPPPP